MSQTYIDHQLLTKLAGTSDYMPPDSDDYLKFLNEIRQSVYALPANHSKVITMYYFECREITGIAEEMELSERDINDLIRESLLRLKNLLIAKVKQRWPEKFKNLRECPICCHPKRVMIEKLIESKKDSESWGVVNRRLKERFKASFNPPSVIISHMKYHIKEK